jgi:hypothetical protein
MRQLVRWSAGSPGALAVGVARAGFCAMPKGRRLYTATCIPAGTTTTHTRCRWGGSRSPGALSIKVAARLEVRAVGDQRAQHAE